MQSTLFSQSFTHSKDRSYVELQGEIDQITRDYISANAGDAHYGVIKLAKEKDPVLKNKSDEEVASELAFYPGIVALAVHQQAHALSSMPQKNDSEELKQARIKARQLTEAAHSRTGIDIHPGTDIKGLCFIDHGTGVVIGETAKMGKGDVIYQGVTLGAYGDAEPSKRHPEIGDECVISAGAKVLGHIIVGNKVTIGPDARLQGNHVTIENDVKIGGGVQIESGREAKDNVTLKAGAKIRSGAHIDGGNIIAPGITIGERAIISKGTGLIDVTVPADTCVHRDNDGSLHFSKTAPTNFVDMVRAANEANRTGLLSGAGI